MLPLSPDDVGLGLNISGPRGSPTTPRSTGSKKERAAKPQASPPRRRTTNYPRRSATWMVRPAWICPR